MSLNKIPNSEFIYRNFEILYAKIQEIECSIEKLLNRIPINIGTGVGLFKRLFNNKFEFKSLVAGNNVTITSTNEEIIINSSAICDEPLFTASVAYGITASDVNHWNTAYAWGNHAAAGYLTSYTETDPIYTSSSWYTTTNNSSNWNTAFSWGNHASAGYASLAALEALEDAVDTHISDTNVHLQAGERTTWNSKQDAIVQRTGTVIAFDKPATYGTITNPETGNLNQDLTGAIAWTIQLVIHNNTTAPTVPVGWDKSASSLDYVPNQNNFIYIQLMDGGNIQYSIDNNV